MTTNSQPPSRSTSVVIDPVAMNIVNKIAGGTIAAGKITTEGGLLVEGQFTGEVKVTKGPLVLMEGAKLAGQIEVDGDAYVFGVIGEANAEPTNLTVTGELHLTSTSEIHGHARFGKLATYEGAKLHAKFDSL